MYKKDPLAYYTIIKPLPAGYEQFLLFATTTEETNARGKTASTTIEREVRINYLGGSKDDHLFQLFLLKTDISFVRKVLPDLVLMRRISYALDELMVIVSDEGLITAILNLPFVQYRWKKVRAELMRDYYDEKFLPYFKTMDNLVESEAPLLRYIQQPSMYGLYFNGYRKQYDNYKTQKQTVLYGEQADLITLEESIEHHLKVSEHSEQLRLKLTAPIDDSNGLHFAGECSYLDGVLEYCKKEVDLGSKKIKYSAKWIGLKSFFQ